MRRLRAGAIAVLLGGGLVWLVSSELRSLSLWWFAAALIFAVRERRAQQ
jgi:hypothetical protein